MATGGDTLRRDQVKQSLEITFGLSACTVAERVGLGNATNAFLNWEMSVPFKT